jgi:hypothetical protein
MPLSRPARSAPGLRPERRGAALLLSVLVLFVLIAIVFQISIATMTDARVGRNDVGLTLIDRSIASAQWDVLELLRTDGEDAAAASDDSGAASGAADMAAAAGGGAGGEESAPPADSRQDEWARVQRTEINGIELRILVEAENAKYNVLNILQEDEEEADEAYQRVVRILDTFREGTRDDVPTRQAEEMARQVREYLEERNRTDWPQPELLTFEEEREGRFLPFSLREFLVLESWEPHLFRCYRDELGDRVHSLDQFLTVWSSLDVASNVGAAAGGGQGGAAGAGAAGTGAGAGTGTGAGAGADAADGAAGDPAAGGDDAAAGQGGGAAQGGGQAAQADTSAGYAVNVNLAPAAVLMALFDDRDISPRFWDDVIEYRNLEEEDEDGEQQEPQYDEFNNEILVRRAFETLEELQETRSWDVLGPEEQGRVMDLLTTESEVFSVYITGRHDASTSSPLDEAVDPRERARMEEEHGGALVRTVRTVVWRRQGADGMEIVTIVPWEVIETPPYELQDYPEDE